jgi:hypothetical protein
MRGEDNMTEKHNLYTILGLAIIALGALLLFYAGDRHRSAVEGVLPNTTFDVALKAVETDAGEIEKVVFLRDPNGIIRQAQITFKSPEKAQLRVATPDDVTTTQLMEASSKSGLPTQVINATEARLSELKSASIFLMIVQIGVPLSAIILLTWLSRRENKILS